MRAIPRMAASTEPSYPGQAVQVSHRWMPLFALRAASQTPASRVGRAHGHPGLGTCCGRFRGDRRLAGGRTFKMGRSRTGAAAYRESRLTLENSTRSGQISWAAPSTPWKGKGSIRVAAGAGGGRLRPAGQPASSQAPSRRARRWLSRVRRFNAGATLKPGVVLGRSAVAEREAAPAPCGGLSDGMFDVEP